MNLWLRLIVTLIKCFFAKKSPDLLELSHLSFRILPFDCDINIHLTNSRYASFMDLARLYHLAQIPGLYSLMIKNRWLPVISDLEIKFIRPIKPFAKIYVQSRLITWNERDIYMEQRFMDRKKLYAIALVKGTFLCKGQRITMEMITQALGLPHQEAPAMPPTLKHWQDLSLAKKAALKAHPAQPNAHTLD